MAKRKSNTSSSKSGLIIGVIIGVIVIAAIIFFVFSGMKSRGDNKNLGSNNAPGDSSKVQEQIKVTDCGIVPQSYSETLNNNPTPEKNEVYACISEKLRNCEKGIAYFKYESPANSAFKYDGTALEVIEKVGDKCKIKSSNTGTTSVQAITCDYPQNLLQANYDASKEKNLEWLSAISIQLVMGMEFTFGKNGPYTSKATAEDGTKIDISCVIEKSTSSTAGQTSTTPAVTTPSNPVSNVCTDTDGGKSYNVKGTASLYGTDYGDLIHEDECTQAEFDGKTYYYVSEYFCRDPTYIGVETHKCLNGCSDGACL